MYFPLFILASAGFGSSSGIAHLLPIFTAPGMRSSLHNTCMRRDEIPHLSRSAGQKDTSWLQPSRSVPLGLSPDHSYNKSLYIIIRLANKINRFPEKFRKNFQFRNQGFGTFPKFQNERIGCKAETLIFPVCTDTGCACYSLKSYTTYLQCALVSRKTESAFLLKSSHIGGQTLKNVRCMVKGKTKNLWGFPPMG